MAYTRTTWKDRAAQFANRFFVNDNGGGDKNFLPPLSDWIQIKTGSNATFTINSDYSGTIVKVTSPGADFRSPPINVQAGQVFTISADLIAANVSGTVGGYIDIYDADTATWLTSTGTRTTSGKLSKTAYVIPSNVKRIEVRLIAHSASNGTFTFNDFQLELGDAITAFAPKKLLYISKSPGIVTEEGTPITAANMNKIEQGIENAHVDIEDLRRKIRMGAM